MKELFARIWLIFELAESPDEVDIAGTVGTVCALLLNINGWIVDMNQVNAALSIFISLLSIGWLTMRCIAEWDKTKQAYLLKRARKRAKKGLKTYLDDEYQNGENDPDSGSGHRDPDQSEHPVRKHEGA